jgi:protocatechuate 3,4-dioxygenase beta subunit
VTPPDDGSPPPADFPAAVEILVRATDSGQPLPGATIHYTTDRPVAHTADPSGRIRVDLDPKHFRYYEFTIWADGYVQQTYTFGAGDGPYLKPTDRLEVDLLPADETLGGTVVDEDGRPIAGVKVEIMAHLGERKQTSEVANMIEATTDAQGHWRARAFRKAQYAQLRLSHPDHVSDNSRVHRQFGQVRADQPIEGQEPIDSLRDFSNVQELPRGVELTGTVRDQAGQPLPGAQVDWFPTRQGSPDTDAPYRATTDAQGRFRFPHVRPEPIVLVARAKGHAPELLTIDATKPSEPLSVVLGPPHTLSGRVFDPRGKPLADVKIAIRNWRSFAAFDETLLTDAEGRFRWDEAPADSLVVSVGRKGYMPRNHLRVIPGEDIQWTLQPEFRIFGGIRDKNTTKPIPKAHIEAGFTDPKTGEIHWSTHPQINAGTGAYGAELNADQWPEIRLRFVARGYKPHESRVLNANESPLFYNADLEPDGSEPTLSGIVHRPDGQPLAGASVVVAYGFGGSSQHLTDVSIVNGRLEPDTRGFIDTDRRESGQREGAATTDAEGRFQLPREPGLAAQYFALIVVHPDFFAEVPRAAFDADPTIVARPWGRIEGIARRGTLPAAGARINYIADRIYDNDIPALHDHGSTTADAQGRFVLDHVVPGDTRISGGFAPPGRPSQGWGNGVLVEVKAGETARVEVGGKGRPIVATIQLPAGFDPSGDYTAHSRFTLESDRPRIPYPDSAWRDGTITSWDHRWWASPEGHAYRRSYFSYNSAKLQPDGTIRVDDVPPGDYRLTLTCTASPLEGFSTPPERVAYATHRFTIPEIPGGQTDEPLDLGPLRPRPKTPRPIGQPMPGFDVETLDGGRATLDQFRGKFLLLHFWSTTDGASLAGLPELKALHDRFVPDDRFALLGLCLDPDKEKARPLVADLGLTWPQGTIDRWTPDGIAASYEVDQPPALFLIGPDGKLLASSTTPREIEAALSTALSQP